MVVGNGLLAKAFQYYSTNDNVIIFASGVSNSSIKLEQYGEFDREKNLLLNYLKLKNKKIIYFSTCSISDDSEITPYINHKINMENLIKLNHNNYLIFRIPLIFGLSENKNTFLNNIKSKILNNETITIYENIERYIIDIDDLKIILPIFIDDKQEKNKIINTCFQNNEPVITIIKKMEKEIGIETNKLLTVQNKNNRKVDNSYFISKLNSINFNFDKNYNKNIIKKYMKIT